MSISRNAVTKEAISKAALPPGGEDTNTAPPWLKVPTVGKGKGLDILCD